MRTAGRVLVIEEDALLRWSLLRYLSEEGREVRAVGDMGAVCAALADPPDVIVFDLDLPLSDAREWLHLLREGAPGAAVIATTADADDEHERAARAGGASAVLRKPFDLRRLRDLVRGIPLGSPRQP